MSMFYRKLENHGDFYHADTIRHRSELKRSILWMCDTLEREMAAFENELGYFSGTSPLVGRAIQHILDSAALLTENLNILTQNRHTALYEAHSVIEDSLRRHAQAIKTRGNQALAMTLFDAAEAGAPLAGGKAAALGKLAGAFPELVPAGFVLTTRAYNLFIEENRLEKEIRDLIHNIDAIADRDQFRERTRELRHLLETAPVPEAIVSEIRAMPGKHSDVARWAVRSSCAGESGRSAFPGQFDSFLNIPRDSLADAYRNVIASRFSDRAVSYRLCRGLSETGTPMAVLFMPMIDARSSGVLFTRNPGDGAAEHVIINSVWGLAVDLMRGRAEADTFIASRSTGEVLLRQNADKEYSLRTGDGAGTDRKPIKPEKRNAPSLTADEVAGLVRSGLEIERHFGEPQDIEWAMDADGAIRALQSRSLMVRERADENPEPGELLIQGGTTVFPGWAMGRAFTPGSASEFTDAPTGSILVVKQPEAEIIHLLPYVNGIVIEKGEPDGQLAARIKESAIPCLSGLDRATEILARGRRIMMDAGRRKVFAPPDSPDIFSGRKRKPRENGIAESPLIELMLGPEKEAGASPASPEHCRSIRDIVNVVHAQALKFNPVSGKIQN